MSFKQKSDIYLFPLEHKGLGSHGLHSTSKQAVLPPTERGNFKLPHIVWEVMLK